MWDSYAQDIPIEIHDFYRTVRTNFAAHGTNSFAENQADKCIVSDCRTKFITNYQKRPRSLLQLFMERWVFVPLCSFVQIYYTGWFEVPNSCEILEWTISFGSDILLYFLFYFNIYSNNVINPHIICIDEIKMT